jgi:pimeloyl-ACP methyl ester carboxylesterase
MDMVLLHGSWHGAWCWFKVAPRLREAGHRVHAPDLPAHGRDWRIARGRITLDTMARSVTGLIDRLPGPALLVAHSRGGIVASTVAQMRPQRAVSPALQRGMFEASPCATVRSIDASHSAYFSQPGLLAQALGEIASAAS